MLHKFNTICRLIIVGLLIYPLPVFAEDVPNEVTINEDFQDSTYQDGLTVTDGNSASFIYFHEQNLYGTTGNSLHISSGTYTFEFSEESQILKVVHSSNGINTINELTNVETLRFNDGDISVSSPSKPSITE